MTPIFAKNVNWAANYHNEVSREHFVALAADLKHEVGRIRTAHAQAHALIQKNWSEYGVQKNGHRRLYMPVAQLSAHMVQVEVRATAQRQLVVLVPLLRLTHILLQQWSNEPACRWDITSVAQYVVQRVVSFDILARRPRAQRYQVGAQERLMLLELAKRHPVVFPEFVPLGPVKLPVPADTPATARKALYDRIRSQMVLSSRELALLSDALLSDLAQPAAETAPSSTA